MRAYELSNFVTQLDRSLYPDFSSNWDDELFRLEILARLSESDCILDLGAGAGVVAQMNFRGKVQRVCGVDPDARVLDNPHLDEARTGVGEEIPYPDCTFDLVFADNVFEHLPNPTAVLKEVRRVLKPGGVFLAKTPNKHHYMPLIARCTPLFFHRWVNRWRGRTTADIFPTRYQINDAAAIHRHAAEAGFKVERIRYIEGRPEYLRFSSLTYLVGYLYERLVNASPGLERLRILIVAVLRN